MAITLILEDGTGVTGANTYIDAAYAAQYFELQGSDVWCNNTSKHNIALVQASAFVDLRYSARFCGEVVSDTQGLLFPRKHYGKESGIPTTLKNAVAQFAFQFLTDGSLDLNANSDAAISSQAVSVGGGAVSETISYFKESGKTAFSAFAVSDRYINQLMVSLGCQSPNASGIQFINAVRS